MALIGAGIVICAVLAGVLIVANPFRSSRPPDLLSIAIDTPYIGQGIEPGSAVVLHGVQVGKIQKISISSDGGVRLITDLQERPIAGLTNTMNIDFRPINYFGVPGINILPNSGGQALRDGTEINLIPKGNFTISELLSQLGDVSAAAMTPRLITVVDRVTRYTDGLNPLLETLLTVTKTVADVQRVPTPLLLANAASASQTLGPFANELIDTAARVADFQYYPFHGAPDGLVPAPSPEPTPANSKFKLTAPYLEYTYVKNTGLEPEQDRIRFLEVASGGLFAAVGKLVSTHVDDLLPLIQGLKTLTDTTPALLRPGDIAQTLSELRSRIEKLFGGNGEQRALQVRILLDDFPAVAAPLGMQGSPPQADGNSPNATLPADGGGNATSAGALAGVEGRSPR